VSCAHSGSRILYHDIIQCFVFKFYLEGVWLWLFVVCYDRLWLFAVTLGSLEGLTSIGSRPSGASMSLWAATRLEGKP